MKFEIAVLCGSSTVTAAVALWMFGTANSRTNTGVLVDTNLKRIEYELERLEAERAGVEKMSAPILADDIQTVDEERALRNRDSGMMSPEIGGRIDRLTSRIERLEQALNEVNRAAAGAQAIKVADSVARAALERYSDMFLNAAKTPNIRGQAVEMLLRFPARFEVWDRRIVDEMLRIVQAPATDKAIDTLCSKVVTVTARARFDGGDQVLKEVVTHRWREGLRVRALASLRRYENVSGVAEFVSDLARYTQSAALAREARAWFQPIQERAKNGKTGEQSK